MKTKPDDVNFCGITYENLFKEPILNQEVKKIWIKWVVERYRVFQKKEKGLPKPWTDWELMQKNKFTNVFREDDRESRNLIFNIAQNKQLTYDEKLLNIMLFRSWNKHETFSMFGGPFVKSTLENFQLYRSQREGIVESKLRNGHDYVFFSNSFNFGGLKYANQFPFDAQYGHAEENKDKKGFEPCIPLRPFFVPYRAIKEGILEDIKNSKDQKQVFENLKRINGFADFMAYQVFVDFTYIEEFPFSENEFVVSGPGCHKGLNALFEDRKGMTDEELLFWLRERAEALFAGEGVELRQLLSDREPHDQCLNVMSIENQTCELSKTIRIINGGKAKNSYNGREEKRKLF